MHKYVVRNPFHLPDGTMAQRGDELTSDQVALLDTEEHRDKFSSHIVRRVHEEPNYQTPAEEQE